jgi:hypothetical protein
MIFDLNDPTRVRALIDMLPESDDMKKELKKLYSDNLAPYKQKTPLPTKE